MADMVNVQNYEDMIDALNTAANNIQNTSEDMASLVNTCVQALGDSDTGAEYLATQTGETIQGLYECVATARDIASAMQEELDAMREENNVWNSDD